MTEGWLECERRLDEEKQRREPFWNIVWEVSQAFNKIRLWSGGPKYGDWDKNNLYIKTH